MYSDSLGKDMNMEYTYLGKITLQYVRIHFISDNNEISNEYLDKLSPLTGFIHTKFVSHVIINLSSSCGVNHGPRGRCWERLADM